MIPCRVILIQKFVKIIKQFPALLVSMEPFFDFAIGLRMLDSRQDMFYLVLSQELPKSAFRFPVFVRFVGKKL